MDELDEFRLNAGGFVDFFIRLECAAENLKLIARWLSALLDELSFCGNLTEDDDD